MSQTPIQLPVSTTNEPPVPPQGWGWHRLFRRHKDDSEALRQTRRVIIAVMGGTVLLLGVLMLVLPGPGIPVTLGGLAILGAEFVWARRMLRQGRVQMGRGTRFWNRWWSGKEKPLRPRQRRESP
jgi:uncharacterized protein (TIGR02611 family)